MGPGDQVKRSLCRSRLRGELQRLFLPVAKNCGRNPAADRNRQGVSQNVRFAQQVGSTVEGKQNVSFQEPGLLRRVVRTVLADVDHLERGRSGRERGISPDGCRETVACPSRIDRRPQLDDMYRLHDGGLQR